jgi:tRNA (guanosine-2'-O-)-methyltransferase
VVQIGPPLRLPAAPEIVIRALREVVTEARYERIVHVVSSRMRSVVTVLDGITDPHNISAVLRSAEAFGVQEVHAVAAGGEFTASEGVSKGSDRWLDVIRYREPSDCALALKARGFEILVATMNGALEPPDLCRIPRLAVVFGNEHAGVSQAMRGHADKTFEIPMRGFVESLNVSVAAAITLHVATCNRRCDLSTVEQTELTARFLMHSVRDSERVVADCSSAIHDAARLAARNRM